MKNIIDSIQQTLKGLSEKQGKETESNSKKWFAGKIEKIKSVSKGQINPNTISTKKEIINESKASKTFRFKKPGYIYFFQYFPPNVKQIPYYDEFPIILSLGFTKNQVIGLNLHLLPPRIRLLFALQIIKSMVQSNNDISKVRIAPLLSNRIIRKYIYAAAESYYYSGVRSKIKLVGPKEFMIMAFLPVEKFKKKQAPQVRKIVASLLKNIK